MNQRSAASFYLLFFCSGAAGLGHQMIWVRLFAAGLGHEVPAILAVGTAVLGGMAAGAWGLGERIRASRSPLRWYGWLELLAGIWAAATGFFVPSLNELTLSLSGPAPSEALRWAVA